MRPHNSGTSLRNLGPLRENLNFLSDGRDRGPPRPRSRPAPNLRGSRALLGVAPPPRHGRAAARDVGLGVAAAAVAVAVELEQLACAAGLLDFDAVREVGEQAVLRQKTPREMEKTRTD